MKRRQKAEIEARARTLAVPAEGLSLVALASALRVDPSAAVPIAEALHRKRIVWLSRQGGHARVYASRPVGRGRPPAASLPSAKLIEPVVERFLIETFPVALRMKLISREGAIEWGRRAEIAHDLAVEAEKITRLCRRYVAEHPDECTPEAVRRALWLAHPDIMPIAADAQPDLARDNDRLFTEGETPRKRLPSNLGDDERMLRYIEAAGPNGIAAYEIVERFRRAITTERVVEIGEQFESMEMIVSATVRRTGRGKRALRYFSAQHGLPQIDELGGRFIARD